MASEWRQLARWPDTLRFHDTRTERILEARFAAAPGAGRAACARLHCATRERSEARRIFLARSGVSRKCRAKFNIFDQKA
jgi:hypothetical protein